MSEPELDVLKWFQRSRRVPALIGRPPGGGRYPGGPYTVAQAAVGAIFFLLANRTTGLWGPQLIGPVQWLVQLTVGAAGLFVGKLVPSGGRNPLAIAAGAAGVAAAPATGRQRGARLTLARTHRVWASRTLLHLPAGTPAPVDLFHDPSEPVAGQEISEPAPSAGSRFEQLVDLARGSQPRKDQP